MTSRSSIGMGLSLAASFIASASTDATTIRVPSEAPTIQAGIDGAANGDTVLVAPGTYTGTGNFNIRFTPLGATEPHDVVLLSEAGAEMTILDIEGTSEENRRGFVFEAGEGPESIVDGFTIRNGFMSLEPTRTARHEVSGGGMVFRGIGTAPTIRNCIFENNRSQISGGAVEAEIRAAPTIESCIFVGNSSLQGGAISLETNSLATIRDCVITGNVASVCGGGIYFSSPGTVEGCTISGNVADEGGGVDASFPAAGVLRNVVVWGNCADVAGDNVHAQLFSSLSFECSAVDSTGGPPPGEITYDAGCIFEDPLFCDPRSCTLAPEEGGDYHVATSSPCLPGATGCGLIGAREAKCSVQPTDAVTWGRLKGRFAR